MRRGCALVLGAVAVLLVVPGATAVASPKGVIQLPTMAVSPGGASRLIALTGTVEGSASVDGGCVWIQTDLGDHDPIVWPQGYSASFDPVKIFDAAGAVVAREGDLVRVGGDRVPVSSAGPRCMFGQTSALSVGQPQVIDDPASKRRAVWLLFGAGALGAFALLASRVRRTRAVAKIPA